MWVNARIVNIMQNLILFFKKIKSAENGIVKLKFRGACHGCPSSEQTLNHGINNLLKYYLPEITEVIKVDDELEAVQLEQFEKLEDSLKNRK